MIINLLPTTEKKQMRHRYHARVVLAGAILFACVTLFSTLALLPAILRLKYEVIDPAKGRQAYPERSKARGATTTLPAITDEIKIVNAQIALVNGETPDMQVTKESVLIARITMALAQARVAARAKITITNWHIAAQAGDPTQKIPASNNISLSGIAENREALLALTKELQRTQGIVSVDNPIANYVPGKNGSFTISVIAQ